MLSCLQVMEAGIDTIGRMVITLRACSTVVWLFFEYGVRIATYFCSYHTEVGFSEKSVGYGRWQAKKLLSCML